MKEKEYEGLSISQDDDGDYKLQIYYEGRKVSDFLICKKRMEQIASMIFINKACEWVENELQKWVILLTFDEQEQRTAIHNTVERFKKAMKGGEK